MNLVKQVLKPRSYDAAKENCRRIIGSCFDAASHNGSWLTNYARCFVDIPWKQAAYGAFLGSATISLGLVAFYLIDRND